MLLFYIIYCFNSNCMQELIVFFAFKNKTAILKIDIFLRLKTCRSPSPLEIGHDPLSMEGCHCNKTL